MPQKTRNLRGQVQDALLALPDATLMETLMQWLDRADAELVCPDWSEQDRYALGYRVQPEETGTIYPSFEAFAGVEPDKSCVSRVLPSLEAVRRNLPREDFYRTLLPLANDMLCQQAYEESWELPLSAFSDDYDFMRCLAVHLCYKGLEKQRPDNGCVSLLRQACRKRRPKDCSSSNPAPWHLCHARHIQRRELANKTGTRSSLPLKKGSLQRRRTKYHHYNRLTFRLKSRQNRSEAAWGAGRSIQIAVYHAAASQADPDNLA